MRQSISAFGKFETTLLFCRYGGQSGPCDGIAKTSKDHTKSGGDQCPGSARWFRGPRSHAKMWLRPRRIEFYPAGPDWN